MRARRRGSEKPKSIFKLIMLWTGVIIFAAVLALGAVNLIVISEAKKHIFETGASGASDIATDIPRVDAIIVPGAKVWSSGRLSHVLEDRVLGAIELYKAGVAPKLLFSGDHGGEDYDEVNAMRKYALEKGVPDEDIFMDHAGFSTYDTMKRAKEVFMCESAVVVTQRFHIYRATYNARAVGIEAYGVNSDPREYANWLSDAVREIAARGKDFLYASIIKPPPVYLGESIPINGDGRVTHDQNSD
ncbi:MAG: SanA/YdcF family protein [Christensenellales bacterium]|jgi:SanA protein